MTCKHYYRCAHYCALTDSCDYLLDTGSRRPHRAKNCPGYPVITARIPLSIRLPGSLDFRCCPGNYGGRQDAGA